MFLLFFILPIIVVYYMYTTNKITHKEDALLVLGITCVLITILNFGLLYYKTFDTLILNGEVTSKSSDRVSCEHSYSCNCTRDSKGNTSCQTCYEHSFDMDWNVHSNVGNVTIARIDRQGLITPQRWTDVIIGEPFSKKDSYTNYVLGNETSLFNYGKYKKEYLSQIPEYPIGIYDYYRANRIIQLNTNYNVKELESKISIMLKTIGPKKQANVILVLTKNPDHNFYYSVRDKWINGKKNDIVVVLGMNSEVINWVETFSWDKNTYLAPMLKNELTALNINDTDKIINILSNNINKYYERKPMAEYEYLNSTISLELWQILMIIVLSVIFPPLSHFLMKRYI